MLVSVFVIVRNKKIIRTGIADSLDYGGKVDAITSIIDFLKTFNLVPHDRLLTKIAALGVDSG
jgi:hypothetical protein